MAIILVPMLLLACIRNLKYLSPVSMLANILQFSGLGIIFYYLLQDLPYSWERKPFASWGQLPLYFGTAIYAFEVGGRSLLGTRILILNTNNIRILILNTNNIHNTYCVPPRPLLTFINNS